MYSYLPYWRSGGIITRRESKLRARLALLRWSISLYAMLRRSGGIMTFANLTSDISKKLPNDIDKIWRNKHLPSKSSIKINHISNAIRNSSRQVLLLLPEFLLKKKLKKTCFLYRGMSSNAVGVFDVSDRHLETACTTQLLRCWVVLSAVRIEMWMLMQLYRSGVKAPS